MPDIRLLSFVILLLVLLMMMSGLKFSMAANAFSVLVETRTLKPFFTRISWMTLFL